ncbi:MAG: SctK family type III secretion system sorting platform protein [Hyphomicrobiales bacterium]|nr:SctK family type III secretion system sorting platform protein [Hyphomicrobiales bacterium]
MASSPRELLARQLVYTLHPWQQWHPSWRARMGKALGVPAAWMEREEMPPALVRRIYQHFQLQPDSQDFSERTRRTLLLISEEASQLLLRLGLLVWWPAFARSIDGRMRRRVEEALGQQGQAVIAEGLERAKPLQEAFGLPRPWAGETPLYQAGYLVWCAALNAAPQSAVARRVRLCLPAQWQLKHSAPPRAPIAPAAAELLPWLAERSFPQCSWLKT